MAGVRGGVFSRLAAGMTALRETAGRWADVLVLAAVISVLFPGTGVMPYRATDMVPPAVGCLVVIAFCPQRAVWVTAS